MKGLVFILYPFSVLYDLVTGIRNRLYDTGVRPSARFEVPLVGVGNLSVGGTGKTPMIEYLIRLLGDDFRVATLSRGYGRKTTGMRIATAEESAATIGDEPMQFFRKFGKKAVVAVGEERVMAIPYILDQHPEVNLILLDDAFQHRRVQPAFQILLTDYANLFVDDYLLPAGRLRESKRGASRADTVVVTKCPPNITDDQLISIESAIRNYSRKAVFFTKICYGNVLPVTGGTAYKPEKVIMVSGIANPAPMEEYLRRNFALARRFAFPDHHHYAPKDMETICQAAAREGASVITSEKDLVKMDVGVFAKHAVPLYYLPIEIEFLKNGKEFDEMVLNAVKSHAR